MRPTASLVSLADLKRLLRYDPETGLFYNLVSGQGRKAGTVAGTVTPRGYVDLTVFGKKYGAHRLAWFYTHGVWPKEEIDHIDRNPTNNAIANLREATRAENAWNQTAHADSSTGHKGITWRENRKRWEVRIYHLGKSILVGRFAELAAAKEARAIKARELRGIYDMS